MGKLETEVKFVIPDRFTFTTLQQLTRLGNFELKSMGIKTVIDRYLDTATKHLYQAGWSCRLRSDEDKQFIGLKSLTSAQGNIHRREEVETEVDTTQISIAQPQAWPESPAKELVVQNIGPALLETLFSLYQTRYKFHGLKQGQLVIELSLDEVSLNDPNLETYWELELELIEQGSEADLASLVEALQGYWPLQMETQSKFERALTKVSAHTKSGVQEGQPMNDVKLTDQEKSTLEKIVDGPDKLLAKRAKIILMTAGGSSEANIAKVVKLTSKTVQRWQKEFSQNRLGIFPDVALNHAPSSDGPVMDSTAKMEPEQVVQTASKSSKKKKQPEKESNVPSDWLQNGEVIEYPVRDEMGLEATDTLAEAGRKVLSFYFGKMLTHEPGTRSGSNMKAVHGMRVATRRMRAAFYVFNDEFSKKTIKPLRAALRATGRNLGKVRDVDVLLEKLQQYQQSLPESEQAGLQPLLELWLSQRKRAHGKLLAYLDSKKYRRLKRDLRDFVTTTDKGTQSISEAEFGKYQLRYLVPCVLYERFRDVHAYDELLTEATLETLYRLRIALKQFRYTLECFTDILGKEGETVIEEVKALQDHLGALNDARVATEILKDLVAYEGEGQWHLPREELQSSTQLASYLRARMEEQQHLLETFSQVWAHFNRPELRRSLALAIAAL
jgi:CHAD domain-containing protein